MKILLAIDGSEYSDMASGMVEALHLRRRTTVIVLTVIPERAFLGKGTLGIFNKSIKISREDQHRMASETASVAVDRLRAVGLAPEALVCRGNPAEVILQTAREEDVSLIVMGAKGLTDSPKFLLGSVAQIVMKHASCSVLLVRRRTTNLKRVLLATDGSKYSDRVTQFLLGLQLPRHTEVAVLTAYQSNIGAQFGSPTLDLMTNQQMIVDIEAAEENRAREIVAGTEELFKAKGHRTRVVVMQGRAAESILMVADKYRADIIALGAKGLTGIDSFIIGSSAERVARHAKCSVLISRFANSS